MRKNTIAASTAAMLACFLTAMPETAHGAPNVFDDAVFWFRGGKDLNGDGYMQQGEFFDDLHADDNSHSNHGMMQMVAYKSPYTGFYENASFRTETVVFPALGTSAGARMQVLHLANKAIKNDNTDYYWPQYIVPRIFKNESISQEYSIVGRMKLDEDGLLARTQCVFRVGYDASSKKGMWLGFSELDETTNTKYITGRCTPGSNSDDSQFDFTNIQIPTNTWFDIAVVVGNNALRIGIAMPRYYGENPIIIFDETDMWTANCESLGATYYRFFTFNGELTTARALANMDKDCFTGSVQQLAIWDRALTDQEVMEAFGMPRPAIFRTGFDNGASNEFGGTHSGASQTIDGLGSWQNIANTMKAGDTWTVNFTALRDEAGLPQIFSMKSLGGSAALIEPVLNGTSLGERRVEENGRVFWPVANNLVSAGANTLVITRKNDGAGDFALDAMELGGSLGVGTVDDSINDGRTAPARTATGVPSAADPNTQHWPQGLQPYTGITNLHFRVWVDPDVANKASFVFKTATQCASRSATQTASGSEYFSILINGKDKGKRRINKDKWPETEWTTHTLSFTPGELIGGWNDFEFVALPYKTCHWFFDYYRFETVLPRAFSLPAPGLKVVLR